MPTRDVRQRLRAAVQIAQQLRRPPAVPAPLDLPEANWQLCQRLIRLLTKAQARGWLAAAARVRRRLDGELQLCRTLLEPLVRQVGGPDQPDASPTLSLVLDELKSLAEEFETLEIDLRQRHLAVTTAPVVLEQVPLGRFRIQLDWQQLGRQRPYRVVACQPQPAASDASLTHPHVQDERLCAGDGQAALRQALATGRLGDFFLIVSRILHSYGPASVYLSLDDWQGECCDDCGELTQAEHRAACCRCGSALCEHCSACCQACLETHCQGCLASCAACGRDRCEACLRDCADCHQSFCRECLTDDLCSPCQDAKDEEDPGTPAGPDGPGAARDPAPAPSRAEAGAATEPHQLGQAAVPA